MQYFLPPWYADIPSWQQAVKNVTLTGNSVNVLKGQSLRKHSIKPCYPVKRFNILNNAARNLDNAEAARGFCWKIAVSEYFYKWSHTFYKTSKSS